VKILLASSSLVAEPTLHALRTSRHEILGCLTGLDAARGRGQEFSENDFARLAKTAGLPIFKPANSLELHQLLIDLNPDIVVTISYGSLIKQRELEIPRYGWLNVHFSLLPRWRGASPVQRAIAAGDSLTGVTVFKLDRGLDTGPIFTSVKHSLVGDETTSTLLSDLASLAPTALLDALSLIEAGHTPIPQSNDGACLAPKIAKEEGRIDWTRSNLEIERSIRAFNPWPTAWTTFLGQRVSIYLSKLSTLDLEPGLCRINSGFFVGCGVGSLEVLEVKPEGKRKMTALEWARGLRQQSDMKFE
jgi:methionyl-tRNA formyltransferase